MDVVVTTCDTHYWALKPFAYLFNRYWGRHQKVVVLGFSPLGFDLPSNFEFYSLGEFGEYPSSEWSTPLIPFFKRYIQDKFIWMFEDYWLRRIVNVELVANLEYLDSLLVGQKILRTDLTADRLYAGGMRDYCSYDSTDLIITDHEVPYQMSLQAGIWDRRLLLELMIPHESPWDFEINGSTRLRDFPDFKVLGTRQWPVRYTIGVWNNKEGVDLEGIPLEDVEEIRSRGYLER